MDIIREYCESSNTCVVRTETYANTFEHARKLVWAAREDFPSLKGADISIKIYSGERFKGMMAIEFTPTAVVPQNYQVIHQLELTAN